MFDIYPKLPNSNKTIFDCIFFYEVEGLDEDFEKTPIDLKHFDPENKHHKFKVDYYLLNKNLDIDVFKEELKAIIDLQEREFYLDLKKELEKSQNDIIFKKKLSESVNSINHSIEALQKQSLNPIQLEVSKLYQSSYKKLIKDLKKEYGVYCSELFFNILGNQELDESALFKKYFRNQLAINKFISFERELITFRYLDDNLSWLETNVSLVKFFKFCVSQEMINRNYEEKSNVLHFLENRYKINLGDQAKPSKFKKVKLLVSDFSFLIK
ncbi:hypothetical protein [Flavobacterium difficile]|uniref:Uncharacterized protein n=1 Tax=Flavobacterium difficile TaxID=2709659 RepID=A0ABX0I509_9FLAO|nr:hypothetical protein [Flavobacterium difficile]NHM01682.1 hypothetical protein [Flavobacterium difficile]